VPPHGKVQHSKSQHWMRMRGQLPDPTTLPPGKKLLVPNEQEGGPDPESVQMFQKKGKISSSTRNQTKIPPMPNLQPSHHTMAEHLPNHIWFGYNLSEVLKFWGTVTSRTEADGNVLIITHKHTSPPTCLRTRLPLPSVLAISSCCCS